MILIKTAPSRIPDRIVLYFENKIVIPLYIDDYVRFHLKSGQDISEDQFNLIINHSLNYLLRNYLLRQVAVSAKTARLLSQKLKLKLRQILIKYKIPGGLINESELINSQISLAEEQGYIDNNQYIESYIRRHPQYSSAMLVRALRAQGLDTSSLHLDDNDSEKIRKLLQKKNYNPSDFQDPKSRLKIISAFVRKGFTIGQVKSAIDEYLKNG